MDSQENKKAFSEEKHPKAENDQKLHYLEFQKSLTANEEATFRSLSVSQKINEVFRNFTVEPIVFSFYMALLLSSVTGQSLIIRKFCLLSFNRTEEECKNLTSNKYLEAEVQKKVANFNMIRSFIELAPGLVFIMFMGSWSDKIGRKPPLILTTLGAMLTMGLGASNAYWMKEIPIEAMYVSGLPLSFVGGFMGINVISSSYIADVSTPDKRTFRIALMQLAVMLSVPLGITLGGIFFSHFGYVTVFLISVGLNFMAFLYTTFVLKETVVRSPESIKTGRCAAFFDFTNVKESFQVLVKKRENNHRTHIILVIFVMTINLFPLIGEMTIAYMYTRLRYQWTEEMYSYFSTSQMASGAIGLLVGIPILSLVFKFSDATIGLLASAAKICSDLIVAFSSEGWMLFIVCPVAILSGSIGPVTQSLISKCVSKEELGKVYSLIGASENITPAIAGVLYTQIYNHTLKTVPGAVYFMSAGLYLIPAILFRYLIVNMRKHEKRQKEKTKSEVQLIEDICVHL